MCVCVCVCVYVCVLRTSTPEITDEKNSDGREKVTDTRRERESVFVIFNTFNTHTEFLAADKSVNTC